MPIHAAPGRDWRLKTRETGKTTSQITRPPWSSRALPHERLENNQFLPSSRLKNGKQRHRKEPGQPPGLQHPRGQTSKGKIKISKHFSSFLFFLTCLLDERQSPGVPRSTRNSWRLENSHSNGAATGRGTQPGPGEPKASVCHRDRTNPSKKDQEGKKQTLNTIRIKQDRSWYKIMDISLLLGLPGAFPTSHCSSGRFLMLG